MPQSIKRKLTGKWGESLDYALNFGIQEFMFEYGISSYTSAIKYLQEISGDRDIVQKCCTQTIGNKPISSQIADEIILRAFNLQRSLEQAQGRNRFLEQQLKAYQREDKRFAIKLLKEIQAIPVETERIAIRGDPI